MTTMANKSSRKSVYPAPRQSRVAHGNTREARLRLGQNAREKASRAGQADWSAKLRKFDFLQILRRSELNRIPRLIPVKHERMCASPFAYFRGAVPVMAADLSRLPNTGLAAQLCGDAHVHNLGSYTAPDGRLAFDINDFDETIQGPWEWDVKRMATSIVLAGREAGDSERQCREAVLGFMQSYRESMKAFSEMPIIELARYQVSQDLKASPVRAVLRRAERATPASNYVKLVEQRNGKHILREQTPLQYRVQTATAAKVKRAIYGYSLSLLPERRHFFNQYRVESVGFRVVGCGSVGVRDFVVLMIGSSADDPLFLQVKEESHSAYGAYLPDARVPKNQGQRVAEGQRAMQLQSDIFLGWTSVDERDYLVRQLRDHKASIEDDELQGVGLMQYARVCGELLAKGHARSGDPNALYGYMGNSPKLDKAIAKFAAAYADQTTKDFETFKRAYRNGRTVSIKRKTKPSKKN